MTTPRFLRSLTFASLLSLLSLSSLLLHPPKAQATDYEPATTTSQKTDDQWDLLWRILARLNAGLGTTGSGGGGAGTNTIQYLTGQATNLLGLFISTTANGLLQTTNGNLIGVTTNTVAATNGTWIDLDYIQIRQCTNTSIDVWVFTQDPGAAWTNGLPINIASITALPIGPIPLNSATGSFGRSTTAGTGTTYTYAWNGRRNLYLPGTNIWCFWIARTSGNTNAPGASQYDPSGTNCPILIGYTRTRW